FTEKFADVLNYDMVPVVFGGADYASVAPPHSFVDALHSFETPRELGKYLLHLAKNRDEYNSFFVWRRSYKFEYEHYSCQICRKLHSNEPRKVWYDLDRWWFV